VLLSCVAQTEHTLGREKVDKERDRERNEDRRQVNGWLPARASESQFEGFELSHSNSSHKDICRYHRSDFIFTDPRHSLTGQGKGSEVERESSYQFLQ
jgi:hypothetical protein